MTHFVVHHTAGANVSNDWPAVVRSIWVLHVKGNGWNDIGYNFLIDPGGTVYEGRAGGDGVLGAHFSGVNSGTSGVALMGTYSDVAAPGAAAASLGALLAWKAERWGIDPAGRSMHSASGLVLNHISGHRDAGLSPRATSSTECPGNGVYAVLPAVRKQVRQSLDGDCPVAIAPLRRCVAAAGGSVEVTVNAPSGCSVGAASQTEWIVPESAGPTLRLTVSANRGARRTGTVMLAGRAIEVIQAEPGAWPMPCVFSEGIVSAAGGDDRPVVAGSLISLYGESLAADFRHAAAAPLPASLAGASLTVNGRVAPLIYASPGQVNAQLPPGVGTGTAQAILTVNGIAGPAVNFSVTEAVPVVFSSGGYAVAVNSADGSRNAPATPAYAGSIVTLWLTGGGAVRGGFPAAGVPTAIEVRPATAPVRATAGALPAEVQFLGLAPGFVGVYQCNLSLPGALTSGDHPIVVEVSGVASVPVRIFVSAAAR